jgi:hypothetical protein
MPIRVLRLIEYVFDDEETYVRQMANMTASIKVAHMTMRSSVMQPEYIEPGKEGEPVKFTDPTQKETTA